MGWCGEAQNKSISKNYFPLHLTNKQKTFTHVAAVDKTNSNGFWLRLVTNKNPQGFVK